jgi:2-keto-4-pentenoate hydratase
MMAAQQTGQRIEPFTSHLVGFDVPAAYAVANIIHDTRVREGARAVGRKIGFTNRDMWSRYGVTQPIWAHLYDTTVRLLDGERTYSIARFSEPKIEPEIVFHFRSAPPVGGDLVSILECIDWVAHAFEIVQSHFPGWRFQAADTIADSALHGALLVGKPQSLDCLGPDLMGALQSLEIYLICDGELREVGLGSNVLGSPLAALAHLIAALAEQPQYLPLQANEIVTTGTVTSAQSIQVGQTWSTQLRGIALTGLSVRLVD